MEKKYSKKDLERIGNNVSSLWGGFCEEVKHDPLKKEYIFYCSEHGQDFITTLKENELEKYNY